MGELLKDFRFSYPLLKILKMTDKNDSADSEPEITPKKAWALKMMHDKDMLKTPCFKETMTYSIGSTTLVAVAYNFTTSKNPQFLIKYVYPVSFFASWFLCRYAHHAHSIRHRKMVETIGSDKFSEYSKLTPEERRIKDEEWVQNIKKTKVKDFRDD